MIDPTWNYEGSDPEEAPTRAASGFVSWHFLRSALRRRWRVWVAAAVVGMMLGVAWTVALPSKSHASVTILLAHDQSTDPVVAMSTDLSLLRTRTVAAGVIDDLGLEMTPEAFQASTVATAVTPTVLTVDVVAADDRTAVARAASLASTYLKFRQDQLESQSRALVAGYQQRVDDLNQRLDALNAQYSSLISKDNSAEAQDRATKLLTQRTQAGAEISQLQQQIGDINLSSSAIVAASHVMDPAAVVPRSPLKRVVLNTGSGMIGGLAVGIGLVLFLALTSDRLRRREEVALALAAPVRFSAGRVSGRAPWWRPGRRRSSPEQSLRLLAQGLESAISGAPRGRPARLALLAVDDVEEAALVTATFAAHLAAGGKSVFLVDLSESGRLEAAVSKALEKEPEGPEGRAEPVVHRPEGPPLLARGPVGAPASAQTELSKGDPLRPAWNRADVVLALAEVDPAVDVDNLTTWVDRVVLLVASGRSSAERLRTTGELVRAAGLQLSFAMMVGADRTDDSSGLPSTAGADSSGGKGSW